MDIYARLREDHKRQRQLAERLAGTSGESVERENLWEEFKTEVEAHANAEEQILYAQLIEYPEAQEQARHSISEHQDASDLVAELSDMDMSSSGWLQRFKKLKESLEHHIAEEEDEVFDLARSVICDNTAHQMVSKFNCRKAAEVDQQ